ncbi:MAG: pyridoxamine 5'-phosphate oxidase family protein [Planctomycetota bacterium]|nr:MAG: pyridoxamine 5'-phosphate oxidase family protein [Planctomycetota bacterium]
MRRKDKQINDLSTIEEIISTAAVCRLGLCQNSQPYIVPLCFGYKDGALYFHSARKGKKLDMLRKNNNVCFEIDVEHELVKAEEACDYGMKYRSVIGFGKAVIIDKTELKREALDTIMTNYSTGPFEYSEQVIERTLIIKVEIEAMTAKKSGY